MVLEGQWWVATVVDSVVRSPASMAEVVATFDRVLGRPDQYVAMPYESAAQFDPDLATLGTWLTGLSGGYIPALRRLRPGMLTLEAWLRHISRATR